MAQINNIILLDIPRQSKIVCECDDGSSYLIYDHPDGMYSYCITEKGNITHLGLMQPLKKVGDHYELQAEE